ncbi:MAG: cytochrome P450 [Parvularculaceae bacterium]|nr:cytochrome P450 [Parvularculaceae bacterium]
MEPAKLLPFSPFTAPNFSSDLGSLVAAWHAEHGGGVFAHPVEPALVVTRHALLSKLSRHPNLQAQSNDDRATGPSADGALARVFSHHPLFHNQPQHKTAHRAALAIASGLGPAVLKDMAEQICGRQLNQLGDKPIIDLVHDYAVPVAALMWAQMVGVGDEYAADLGKWANAIRIPLWFQSADEQLGQADEGAANIEALIAEKSASLRAATDTNVVQLADQSLQSPGSEPLDSTGSEIVASMTFDAIDGSAGMLANMFSHLLQEEGAWDRLREDPNLADAAWMETARLSPPILGLFRSPTEDTEVDGHVFPAGTNVLMFNAAANRDPLAFAEPDRFDLDRKGPVLATFGYGPRACVGRALARTVGVVALRAFLGRYSAAELLVDEVDWGPCGLVRAVQNLPVRVTAV